MEARRRKAAMRRLGGGLILILPRGEGAREGESDVTFMKCYNLCKALIALLHAHTYTHTGRTRHIRSRANKRYSVCILMRRAFLSVFISFLLFFSFFISHQSKPRRYLTNVPAIRAPFSSFLSAGDVLCGFKITESNLANESRND